MLTDADDDERRILLTDFGIARPVDEISGLTTTNMTVGTVAYCAPEQLMGEDVDSRTDQYALAATAYHLLSGAPPFVHTNPAVVISRHLNAEPPPLSTLRPELAALDAELTRALSKDPANRYTRCGDFAAALKTAAAEPAGPAPAAAKGSAEGDSSQTQATRPAPTAGERTVAAQVGTADSGPSERPVTEMAGRERRWLKPAIVAPAVFVAVLAVAKSFAVINLSRNNSQPGVTVPSAPETTAATTAMPGTTAPRSTPPARPNFATNPVRLQFDIESPKSIALDNAGNLYIGGSSRFTGLLYKLAAGASAPTLLPVNGLGGPCAMTFNKQGDLYILDGCSNAGSTLLKIPAGSSTPVELTPNLPSGAWAIAVDSHDNLYLACSNRFNSHLVKLAPGASEPTEIPHPGVEWVSVLAVDAADNLYAGASRGEVIKLSAATTDNPSRLPFPVLTGSNSLQGITVDEAGTIYTLTTNYGGSDYFAVPSAVMALPPGASSPITLNFGELINRSGGIAVDGSGLYVINGGSTIDQKGYVALLRRSG